jgi:hypothetical protein
MYNRQAISKTGTRDTERGEQAQGMRNEEDRHKEYEMRRTGIRDK